jgi:hypothetical protein
LIDGVATRAGIDDAGWHGVTRRGWVLTITGTIDADAFQIEFSVDGDGIEPNFVFAFDLARQTGALSTHQGQCDRVIWQPRALANPFGGSVSSVMVSFCIPSSPADRRINDLSDQGFGAWARPIKDTVQVRPLRAKPSRKHCHVSLHQASDRTRPGRHPLLSLHRLD